MNQNYCFINKNKIYGEIYDELLEEELSMNNNEHNDKIKRYIEKKIKTSNYISLSEVFVSNEELISDLILKITSEIPNENLQGNTVLMFAGPNEMYELFHMEDLVKKSQTDNDLNEFGSISNIQLLPIYWGCGIVKTSYLDGNFKGSIISKDDIINLFIQNYYHVGVMIGFDKNLLEIEFTGEDPFKIIGSNFSQSNVTDVIGFNIIPYIEKGSNEINYLGSKLLGREIKGRLFVSLLCPTTNKKFWNINKQTINNILKILDNKEKCEMIYKELEMTDKDINPFYLLTNTLLK